MVITSLDPVQPVAMLISVKKLYIMLFTSSLIPTAIAQWSQIPSPPQTGDLWCIDFFDDDIGAIGCDRGILKTYSGGVGWFQGMQASYAVYGFSFPNATVGFGAAEGGRILKTSTNGTGWTDVYTNNTPWVTFRAVVFPNFQTGFVLGSYHTIRKTSDGGITWQSRTNGTATVDYYQGHFFNTTTGVIVGEDGNISRTTIGGGSWVSVPSGTTSDLFDLHFPSASTGYAVGANGIILKTTDAGQSWTTLSSGTTTALYAVQFENDLAGYVAGKGDIVLKTLDGGATWEQEQMGIFSAEGRVNDLAFHGGRYLAVGDSGRIASHDALVGVTELDGAEQRMSIRPNPALNTITLSSIGLVPGPVQIAFINPAGQRLQVVQIMFTGADLHMDVSTLPAGLYACELRHAHGLRMAMMLKE